MKNYIPKYEEFVNEDWIGPFVFNDKMKDDELKAIYQGALDGFAYWQKGFEYPKADYKKAYQEIGKLLKKRGINVDESVNEGSKDEMVKKEAISRLSDFFRVSPGPLMKFKFDGSDNIKDLTKVLNSTSDQGTELYYKTAIKLAKEEVGVEESVNEQLSKLDEGAVKAFEMDYADMVKNIKSGYGWIDPEYVANTWENSSDTIDFEIVKDEIYNRLIKAGLLFFADPNDEETKGKKVTNISQI